MKLERSKMYFLMHMPHIYDKMPDDTKYACLKRHEYHIVHLLFNEDHVETAHLTIRDAEIYLRALATERGIENFKLIQTALDDMRCIADELDAFAEGRHDSNDEVVSDLYSDFNRVRETLAEALVLLERYGTTEHTESAAYEIGESLPMDTCMTCAEMRCTAEPQKQNGKRSFSDKILIGCGLAGIVFGVGMTALVTMKRR